jgi:hypothetical protein
MKLRKIYKNWRCQKIKTIFTPLLKEFENQRFVVMKKQIYRFLKVFV